MFFDFKILNDPEKAKEIARDIETTANTFSLTAVSGVGEGCINVSVEEACVNSYERGCSFTEQLKSHVVNASSYIQQISDTLEAADQAAVFRAGQFDSFQGSSGTGKGSSLNTSIFDLYMEGRGK